MLYPNLPDIRIYKTDLKDIDFPLVFKLCVMEKHNSTARYTNVGYEDSFDFFKGVSMYNKSLYGWRGHHQNGSTIARVEGKILSTPLIFKETGFIRPFKKSYDFRHTPEYFL